MQDRHPTTGFPLLVEMKAGFRGHPVIRYKGKALGLMPFLHSLNGVYPGAQTIDGQAAADLRLLARPSEV